MPREERPGYDAAGDSGERRLRAIVRELPPEDRALLIEFAELLGRRHRERRE